MKFLFVDADGKTLAEQNFKVPISQDLRIACAWAVELLEDAYPRSDLNEWERANLETLREAGK